MISKRTQSISYKIVHCIFNSLLSVLPTSLCRCENVICIAFTGRVGYLDSDSTFKFSIKVEERQNNHNKNHFFSCPTSIDHISI